MTRKAVAMQFASKTPRDLVTFDGDVCIRCWGLVPRDGVTYVPDDGSLCECDILSDVVQHNEPNSILVAFRDWLLEPVVIPEAASWWLQQIDGPREVTSHAYRAICAASANAEQYNHARRVLVRLARLTEGASA